MVGSSFGEPKFYPTLPTSDSDDGNQREQGGHVFRREISTIEMRLVIARRREQRISRFCNKSRRRCWPLFNACLISVRRAAISTLEIPPGPWWTGPLSGKSLSLPSVGQSNYVKSAQSCFSNTAPKSHPIRAAALRAAYFQIPCYLMQMQWTLAVTRKAGYKAARTSCSLSAASRANRRVTVRSSPSTPKGSLKPITLCRHLVKHAATA